jgi:hypothetical protein
MVDDAVPNIDQVRHNGALLCDQVNEWRKVAVPLIDISDGVGTLIGVKIGCKAYESE